MGGILYFKLLKIGICSFVACTFGNVKLLDLFYLYIICMNDYRINLEITIKSTLIDKFVACADTGRNTST